MASSEELQDRVRLMLHAGSDLARVERDVIDQATLDDEERAALWLYAWALDSRASYAYARKQLLRRERFRRAATVSASD